LINITKNDAKINIFIGDLSYWKKGIAYNTMSLLLKETKEKLKLKYIYLWVNTENIAAIKLYERVKFLMLNDKKDTMVKMEKTL